ncbi:anaerobic dehydrogenase [Salmonella enterica]|nr:anaerobic dehydrogenase [Salmonella enterica]
MSKLLTPKLLSMGGSIYFHCPGCNMLHPYRVSGQATGPIWQWNNNPDLPTFTPSLLVNHSDPASRCHLFLTDGKLQFLGDCFHELKNQTVEMVDIPEPEIWID